MGQSDFCSIMFPRQQDNSEVSTHFTRVPAKPPSCSYPSIVCFLLIGLQYKNEKTRLSILTLNFTKKAQNQTFPLGRVEPYFLTVQALGIWCVLVSLCGSFVRQATHFLDDLDWRSTVIVMVLAQPCCLALKAP